MNAVVTILFILICILLIGVVLIQQPKTAGGLFSGTGQSLLGTSGKTFWTKFTTILAGVFMALCLLMAALPRFQQPKSSVTDLIEKNQQAAQVPVSAAAPASSQAQPKPQVNSIPGNATGASQPAPVSGK